MELNRSERVAYVKVAYCGPAGAGKGTNLRALHDALRPERRGGLRSLETGGCATLRLEFDPPSPLRLGGFQMRFGVATVPGPGTTLAARKQLLQGADGVVFVADSSRARLHETMASFRETTRQITAPTAEAVLVPLVLQYNKRDVADPLSETELEQALNPKRLLAAFATVATRREVFDTFAAVFLGTMTMLARRPESQTLLGTQDAESWTRAAIGDLFAPVPAEPTVLPLPLAREQTNPGRIFYDVASEPITRRLSASMVEEALAALQAAGRTTPSSAPATSAAASRPDAMAAAPAASPAPPPGAATHPPAPAVVAPPPPAPPHPATPAPPPAPQAGAEEARRLARERDAARGERDRFRARYQEIAKAVKAARALHAGEPPAPVLHELLRSLARGCAGRSACLLAPARGGGVTMLAGLDAGGDALADSPDAGRLVAALVAGRTAPVVHDASSSPALARALEAAGYDAAPVVCAPLRTARGLHAVLLVYLDASAPPPDPALLEHLASVADALALAIARG